MSEGPLDTEGYFERIDEAEAIYDALVRTGTLARARVLQYRCADKGCGVMDIVRRADDGQLIVGFPRYKTSPDWTERSSNTEGRAKNTVDGQRRWNHHARYADAISNPVLSCDHLRLVVLKDEDIQQDLAAGVSVVRVKRDGNRYALD